MTSGPHDDPVTVPERHAPRIGVLTSHGGPVRLRVPTQAISRAAARQAWLGRRLALAVWAAWLVALGLVVVGVATAVPSTSDAASIVGGLLGSVAAVLLASVGGILVTRLPGNRIGWLLWASGVLLAFSMGVTGPLVAGLPGAVWLFWLVNLTWLPPIVFVGLVLPLLFPTGRLPSPRWRPVVIIAIGAMTLALINAAFSPFSPGSAPAGMRNPLEVTGAAAGVLSLMSAAASLAAVVCFPLAAVSLVVRYRRASGVERAQLRWFAAAGALIGVSFVLVILAGSAPGGDLVVISNVAWPCLFIGLALLPVAIGIAVLRYRLYEIDRLISRTLGYGLVTLALLAVFSGAILALQALLSGLTGGNTLAVAGSTLLVAALFQPLRRRVQAVVDRRFNRSRYDAQVAVESFSAGLRDEVDLKILQASLLAVVETTLEPSTVSVWLRD